MVKTRQNQDTFEAKYYQNVKMAKNNTITRGQTMPVRTLEAGTM
jgi:hypothetical protein